MTQPTEQPDASVERVTCVECQQPRPILIIDYNTPKGRGVHDTRDPRCHYAQLFDIERKKADDLRKIEAYGRAQQYEEHRLTCAFCSGHRPAWWKRCQRGAELSPQAGPKAALDAAGQTEPAIE